MAFRGLTTFLIRFRIILTTPRPFRLFLVSLHTTAGSHLRTHSFVYTDSSVNHLLDA